MANINKVLVVGGGIAGMSATLELRKRDIAVDLVDIDPDWKVYGAGITVTGPTLRAFRTLGILDEMKAQGFLAEALLIYTMDGILIKRVESPVLDEGLPSSGGIMRPALHRILSYRVKASGANVGLGYTIHHIEQGADTVNVTFTNETEGEYDLVVGADGFVSKMREMIFPDAPNPEFTGQGAWRMNAQRPADMTCAELYFGKHKVGIIPCSPDQVYVFSLEKTSKKEWPDVKEYPARLRQLLQGFAGRVGEFRDAITPESDILFRPLEALLLPRPWSRGNVVLIGDAAHATTPHLATGAGIAAEDAIVLVEELAKGTDIQAGLDAFMERRYERCRMVVENSVKIGELEQSGAPPQEIEALMGASNMQLSEPI